MNAQTLSTDSDIAIMFSLDVLPHIESDWCEGYRVGTLAEVTEYAIHLIAPWAQNWAYVPVS